MTDAHPKCLCVVDTDGLYRIATASENLRPVLIDLLTKGVIGVPTCAWQEFEKLYEDEAAELKEYVAVRINMRPAYYAGAARIADKLNSGFPRGSHDECVELWTGAIATAYDCIILTSAAQVKEYQKMECEASELEEWVEAQQ
jgi:hypothetical protein